MEIFNNQTDEEKREWLKKRIALDPDDAEFEVGVPMNTVEDYEAFGKFLRAFVENQNKEKK